jgi:outer membrane protein OmpA-like peptidoglycan-associated protein
MIQPIWKGGTAMNLIRLVFLLCFLASQGACAHRGMNTDSSSAPPKAGAAQEVVTAWGGSGPTTRLVWSYQESPTPPFEGTPDSALTEIGFAANSTSLDSEARGALRTARESLSAGRDPAELGKLKLLVVGFTDSVAERRSAQELGLRRAEATRAELVNLGFPKENIQVSSYGARYSVARDWEKLKQESERNVQVWVLK